MNIHADGIDSLTVAIDDLRAEVDRWINEQKIRLRSLEETAADEFDVTACEDAGPIYSAPIRMTPGPRPSAPSPTSVHSGPSAAAARRAGSDDSGVSPGRGSGDSISSRDRLDALARHLNDRLRRNKDQSSERVVPPPAN